MCEIYFIGPNLLYRYFLKAKEVTGLSAGEDYTFKLVVVKHDERRAEVSTNSNTSES